MVITIKILALMTKTIVINMHAFLSVIVITTKIVLLNVIGCGFQPHAWSMRGQVRLQDFVIEVQGAGFWVHGQAI